MALEQLELFEFTPDEKNAQRIEEVQASLHKVRKGTYASIGEMNKRLARIEEMLEPIIAYVCKK